MKKPVITGNQTTLVHMLRLAHINDNVDAYRR